MKYRTIIFLLLLFTQTVYSSPKITKQDLDDIKLNPSLPQLIGHLESLAINAPDLVRDRKRELTKSFYSFQSAKAQLHLLKKETDILWQLYTLNKELSKKGEVTDVQLLMSYSNYLSNKVAQITKKTECQNLILEITRLTNLEIQIKE